MNPKRVVVEGTDTEVGWMCQCGITYSSLYPNAKESATVCCMPSACPRCHAWVKPHGLCSDCVKKFYQEKSRKEYDSATKISVKEYGDKPVYRDVDDIDSGSILSLQDAKDSHMKWAWATEARHFYLEAMDVVSQELESHEHHEEAFSSISKDSFDKLQCAMDAFCEEVKIVTYFKDESTVVLIEGEE